MPGFLVFNEWIHRESFKIKKGCVNFILIFREPILNTDKNVCYDSSTDIKTKTHILNYLNIAIRKVNSKNEVSRRSQS